MTQRASVCEVKARSAFRRDEKPDKLWSDSDEESAFLKCRVDLYSLISVDSERSETSGLIARNTVLSAEKQQNNHLTLLIEKI